MAEWPDSLPPLLVEGYSRGGDDGVIRSQMDGGLRIRPRFTTPPFEQVTAQMVCTQSQLQTLLDFWGATLRRVLPFNAGDPAKGGAPAVYRFAARPSYVPHRVDTYWRVTLQLQSFPVPVVVVPSPGELLLASARILVDWSSAADSGGKYARNNNDPRTITPNLLAFPTGPIVNEAGSASPPRTNFYPGATDPGGEHNATRLLTTATNQTLYFLRPGQISPTLPTGTYSLRFRARAAAGTGPWGITYGLTTGLESGSVQDLDWEDPANEVATTFETEFTYSGSGDVWLRIASNGSDILIDRIQFHDGPLSSMPAWSDFVTAGGRKAFAFEGSLVLDGGGVDTTDQTSGLLVFDPDFPAAHSYSAYTVMSVSSVAATPSATAHIVNIHPNDGGSTIGNVLQAEGTSPYAGEINASDSASSRAYHAANLAGYGLFISGHGRSATTRKVWIDTVPAYIEDRAFAGVSTSRWTVGGFSTSNVADLRGNLASGKYAYTVIWDRLLTDDEWRDAANALRERLADRSVTLAPLTDYHVISGDSNSTRANGDWTQLVTAKDYLTPQRNLIASITSVGGQGIDQLERDAAGSESGLPDGTITDNGRFGKYDKPALLGGVEDGRYSLYHLPIGTNDWDIIGSIGTAAYIARLQTFIGVALATHERVHVMWYSLLPQNTSSSGRENWESWRTTINPAMQSWIDTQDRVHLCDFGGAATIGDAALFASTYSLSDGIHFNSDGDIEAASISGDAVKAWRTALGIA